MGKPTIQRYVGADASECIDELAALRIAVFREFPYLYDGSLEYERRYLATYLQCPQSLVVIVRDRAQVVGASSAVPLSAEDRAFQLPFEAGDWDIHRIFYFGESVLRPEYRGLGLGHRFFDEREAYARSLGRFDRTAFCAVNRSRRHRLRPADYRPLTRFWKKRGYTRHPELVARFSWKDIDKSKETAKTLTFWTRPLNP